MKRIGDLFARGKPLIAMVHLLPLPGAPLYDEGGGMENIVEKVRADMDILLDADFDAVLFCNEGDRPYSFDAGYGGVAAMTRVVAELAPKDRPFGVDFLWDTRAALAVAATTGASFIRGVMTGAYESDMGIWNTDAAAVFRERRRLDADDIAMFMNITPEFASSFGTRSVRAVARSAVVSSLADAILISGHMQGAEPSVEAIVEARDAVGPDIPVVANTGAKSTNLDALLEVTDGIIVGSDLKRDGYTWAPVDRRRVERFIEVANRLRAQYA